MEDTYENRALFLVMWYGAPAYLTSEMFPEWTQKRKSLKAESVEETLWLQEFTQEAFEMRKKSYHMLSRTGAGI